MEGHVQFMQEPEVVEVAVEEGILVVPLHLDTDPVFEVVDLVGRGVLGHADQGGLCVAWYLLILTIFRPNLEDRVALSAVRPAWGRRRKG